MAAGALKLALERIGAPWPPPRANAQRRLANDNAVAAIRTAIEPDT